MSGTEEPGATFPDFAFLSPSLAAEAAEAVLDRAVDGTLAPYPSYVNRVYGMTTAEGRRFLAKFYRPGRWTEEAIREEHALIAECAGAELPVVQPIPDAEGETLSAISAEDESGGERTYYFALFPHISGRGWEAESADDWIRLGRLIAAVHSIGKKRPATARSVIHPELLTRPALRRLVTAGLVHPDLRAEFEDICDTTLDRIAPFFDASAYLRLHGDLHRGNILRPQAPTAGTAFPEMALIDFDDMANGPAIQDLWLFLPGRLDESRPELGLLLEGYEESLPLDRSQIDLIEPLRFMRMLGYLDWQARQRADAGFLAAFPDWGTRPFWIKEIEDLRDQARVVAEGTG